MHSAGKMKELIADATQPNEISMVAAESGQFSLNGFSMILGFSCVTLVIVI